MDDYRARLECLRDQLAGAILVASDNMLPQLAGQYRATLADLAALPSVLAGIVEGSVDDLQARRADRIAAAKVAASAGGKAHKRGS